VHKKLIDNVKKIIIIYNHYTIIHLRIFKMAPITIASIIIFCVIISIVCYFGCQTGEREEDYYSEMCD